MEIIWKTTRRLFCSPNEYILHTVLTVCSRVYIMHEPNMQTSIFHDAHPNRVRYKEILKTFYKRTPKG